MKTTHLCFILSSLTFASPILAADVPKKAPVPADTAQAEAMKLIKEVYGDEYAKAKTSAEKQALAKKLLGKASESKDDPASQFVLLRLARDIATQSSDRQTTFQAIDAMAESFQIDVLAMKVGVLTKFASAAQKPAHHKTIAEEALKLVEQSIIQDNFTVATQLGKLALDEAQETSDKELISKVQGRIAEATETAKAYEEVKAAKMTLEKTPDDPAANLVVGKYLCFFKGEWDQGLPMLALGKDESLKALAGQELAGAASSSEQAKLGDGWWGLAEKEEGATQKQMQRRAGYWYRRALPGLSGLTKDKVEKRIGVLEKQMAAGKSDADSDLAELIGAWDVRKPGYQKTWVFSEDGKVTIRSDGSVGTWTAEPRRVKVQWSGPKNWETFQRPISPQGVTGDSWQGRGILRATKTQPDAKKTFLVTYRQNGLKGKPVHTDEIHAASADDARNECHKLHPRGIHMEILSVEKKK